ncbi:MAG: NO-inducible flavohemoprotein [Oceanospirillales bacterium]|nr:NO-inducible flavohemoprotein [Oceanospirillales bacterium]
MLTPNQIAIVKSTIPLLASAGSQITDHFYSRMFSHNPELKNIFNMSHQHSGRQSVALFNAVAAYAQHIDNLPVLQAAVERIAQKHTSFDIRPEQYAIVGHHLIHTLKELAPDAFTPEVEDAWTAAYQQLADIFIQREGEIYQQNAHSIGGWEGARRFRLQASKQESELVKSFIFTPVDQQPVVGYQPGQYLGIRVQPSRSDYQEMRQYSLSDQANGSSYRISVKREQGDVDGLVSNFLHDELNIGDEVELFAPAGDFFFTDRQQPVVLISAGVGITPMMATLETLAQQGYPQPVSFLHACEHAGQHSFDRRLHELSECLSLSAHVWYNQGADTDAIAAGQLHQGLMALHTLRDELPLLKGDFYLCGPVGFMRFIKQQLVELGVGTERIHYEVFGPHADL